MEWNTYDKYRSIKDIKSKYFFQTPINKFNDLVSEFGNPNIIDNDRNGMAIWNKLSSVYHRIDLIDNPIYNAFPCPHIGFLYVYYKYEVPISRIAQVLSISGDIKYDPIECMIIVRGMSLGYCNEILVFVIKFCKGSITWHQITTDQLFKKRMTFDQLTNPKNIQYNKNYLKSGN